MVTNLPIWIIEPRDPLVIRDGRPFGATPGARAESLPFPFPSTTAGGVRTRAGLDADGIFDSTRIGEVLKLNIQGPLLVALNDEGEIVDWLIPAPADALLLDLDRHTVDKKDSVVRKRLVPLKLPTDVTDLDEDLAPVGLTIPDPRKPFGTSPRFWRWREYEAWLACSSETETPQAEDAEPINVEHLGYSSLAMDVRTHISIQPDTQTAADGALFQTRGLEFTTPKQRRRLALAVATNAVLKPGVAPLGGERRLVNWRASQLRLPACPPALRAAIVDCKACRVVLLTPACFQLGFRPTQLLQSTDDVTLTLRAIANQRAQVVSGWDMARGKRGEPKPTRRLVPAGSVFFLSLEGSADKIGRWVDETWMQCVSDAMQDCLDGFGLAALGTWSGTLAEMKERA